MIVLAMLGLMAVLLVVRGVTIDVFWDWFLIDAGAPFHGQLPAIDFAQALGLSLLIAVFTYDTNGATADGEVTKGESTGEFVIRTVVLGTAIYGVWWIVALIVKTGI